MDWMEFVSSMTGSLAWPVAAVAIVYGFRDGILKRLPDLSSLTLPGGISAEFKRELALVEATVTEKELPKLGQLEPANELEQARSELTSRGVENACATAPNPEAARQALSPEKEYGSPASNVLFLNHTPAAYLVDHIALHANPTGVVMEAWTALESEIRACARKLHGLGGREILPVSDLVTYLLSREVIDKSQGEQIMRMYTMRNLAAHTKEPVTEEDASRFKAIATSLANRLVLRRILE
ncbi:MAG: hypothetical protein ACJ8LG_06470 [Massilia sp.]